MMRILLILIVMFGFTLYAQAQEPRENIRKGNELYEEDKFEDAEIEYRKAIGPENDYKGIFNLGDALYKQGNYEEAAEQFLNITSKDLDEDIIAKAYHNLGNSYLNSEKFEESIKAYKSSLRKNPDDLDTKYNLEYAKKKLIQQQQQQKQQNQDKNKDKDQDKNKEKQDQKDKNKDKKDKDSEKNDKNKDEKQKQKQDQNGEKKQKDQKSQEQGQKQQKISKKDAERILKALNADEKKLQKKLKKKKKTRSKVEKNW